MTIHILNEQNTILNTFLAELRDKIESVTTNTKISPK